MAKPSRSVRTQLLTASAVALGVMLLVGSASLQAARAGASHATELERTLPAVQAASDLAGALTAIDGLVARLTDARVSDAAERRALLESARLELLRLEDAVRRFEQSADASAHLAAWSEFKPLRDAWRKEVDRLLTLQRQRDDAAADPLQAFAADAGSMEAMVAMAGPYRGAQKVLFQLVAASMTSARAAAEATDATLSRSVWVTLLAFAVGLASLTVVGAALHRSILGTARALTAEAARLCAAVDEGRLDERADQTTVAQEFREAVDGMNRIVGAFLVPLRATASQLDRIARGDIPPPAGEVWQGEFGAIRTSLDTCEAAVTALVDDAKRLTAAAVAGQLSARADAGRHQGDFRRVIEGVNRTLDAVVGPIAETARHLEEIAAGRIPAPVTSHHAGDFSAMEDSLNHVIAAVNALVEDAEALSRGAVAGQLDTRGDPTRHRGDYRKVIEGVNATLDAVVGPLTTAASTVDRLSRGDLPPRLSSGWKGDFGTLEANLNHCRDAVEALVVDVQTLAGAASAGQLATRAEAGRHQGEFRTIVEGINQTLAAVVLPIAEATSVLERLAQRDLTARTRGTFCGDHDRLAQAVNGTATALHDPLAQVAEAAGQVTSAAAQIAASSQAVATGASEQAVALQQTTSALGSVSSMAHRAADDAERANALVQTASGAAREGSRAVVQLHGAMDRIRTSAEATSQIVKDINDIAFQTNLLALNAAVEAARAGEAGAGFAVVAGEVRSLALRSKEAARKTEALIRESVRQAGEGELTSRQVAGRLDEIVEGVGKVTGIVSEIAAAAKEQTGGIETVNHAVGEMERVTQQNAASAQQSSSAASQLNGQAVELAAMVGAFRLDQGGRTTPLPPPPPPRAPRASPPRAASRPEPPAAAPACGDRRGVAVRPPARA